MPRICRVVVLVMLASSAARAVAQEVNFFSGGIDYWKEAAAPPVQEPKADAPDPKAVELPESAKATKETLPAADSATQPKTVEGEKFDWRPFLDAKNKEFFREGDYTPPEPFMEIMRDPSDANLRMWFEYIERKNALTQRLAARMDEYVRRQGGSLSQPEKARVETVARELPRVDQDDYRALRFRMYFDSTCPHCQKMFATLNALQERGYFVEARQIDSGSLAHIRASVPIQRAAPEEVKRFQIRSVPFLLIGDMRKGAVYRQTGFATPEEILSKFQSQP
jgi:glutaredoxin